MGSVENHWRRILVARRGENGGECVRVHYKIILSVDVDDYVETLGNISDVIQNEVDGNPRISRITAVLPQPDVGDSHE